MELTQEILKSLLHYDPETGIFTWINRPFGLGKNQTKEGMKAGNLAVRGYIDIRINRIIYKAQRLAVLYMLGRWPEHEVDHRNELKHDNRWVNLREGTHQDNCHNQHKPTSRSISGLRGVMWYKQTSRWHAQIAVDGKQKHLGFFDTKEEARAAYLAAKKRLHPFSQQ